MSKTEYNITRDIMKRVSKKGARVFRNNVGMGWAGKHKRVDASTVIVKNARPLHSGLTKGSSDLIGWTPVKVTEDHVGTTLAVFTAIEVKDSKRKATKDQRRFIEVVRNAGGLSGVARSPEQAEEIIKNLQMRNL